ncbi:putative glycolipid-binding domain-containing protein [Nocardiopsis coralliicola]
MAVGALVPERSGYRLEASETVGAGSGGTAYACRVTVQADLAWETRSVRLEAMSASGVRTLALSVRGGCWTVDGVRRPDLDGCVDVDVASTPITATLPIRRLGLRLGEFRDIAAARIAVPALTVERRRQRYTRLEPAGGRARYEQLDPADGPAVLTADHEGLVVHYEGLYERA